MNKNTNNTTIPTIFTNPEFGSVRVITINDEPWFVGKDVATALGYKDPNKAIAMHVEEEDKLNDKMASSLGQRGGWLINESGVYSLTFGSKLESAKRFKHWVTSEVLPTIRKTGGYVHNDDLFISTYLPLADEATKALFRVTLTTIREQNQLITTQKKHDLCPGRRNHHSYQRRISCRPPSHSQPPYASPRRKLSESLAVTLQRI